MLVLKLVVKLDDSPAALSVVDSVEMLVVVLVVELVV